MFSIILKLMKNGAARVVLTRKILDDFNITDAESSAIVGTPGRIDCALESWGYFRRATWKAITSVRLRSKTIVINEIAKRHDGGGHPLASGANSYNLEETNKSIKKSRIQLPMQLTNRRVRLMGTVIDVSIYHKEPEPLLDQVEALLHTYNKRFSANDDSSELMKINKAAGLHPVTVHPELFELISLEKWHSCQPGSHLNIAIGLSHSDLANWFF